MKELRFYVRSLRLHLLGGVEYKGWWIMVLQVLVVAVTDPIGTVLMFARFGSVGSWSVERILLIYALAVTSYGLAESLFRGFDYFPSKMVRSGDFDRLLLRPRTLFTQAAVSYFHIHRLARPAAGLAVVFWCLARQNTAPSPRSLWLLVSALLGGTLVYAGVFVFMSGISFFTVGILDWMIIFTNASYQVTRIPLPYMPGALRSVFTFVMPMLVISYYPASVLCGWGEPLWKGLLALPAGAAFLGLSLLVWRVGVRHYKSTGS
ncbi:MAG: ABC-2 family transporter protein [Oscillospiraceae bacterium]|jgi:ABC-2 type transport system permease protein|nr:ABC-2 family transporter protein [Oscillospiraceae bacterium]